MSLRHHTESTFGRFIRDVGVAGRRLIDHDVDDLRRYDLAFEDRLAVQLENARRHDRTFTITIVPLDDDTPVLDVVRRCDGTVRLLDAVTALDGELLLLWAETAKPEATLATLRLIDAQLISGPAVPRHATYPHDGITVEALVDAAEPVPVRAVSAGRRHRPGDGRNRRPPQHRSAVAAGG